MADDIPAGFFIRTPINTAIAAAPAIGINAGSCGAVTQATSKTTAVTLSRKAGVITMNNAALATVTAVKFTLTNTTCGATDIVLCNQGSGGTAGAYSVEASAAAGSIVFRVENNTAGSLSEAVTINYLILDSQAG